MKNNRLDLPYYYYFLFIGLNMQSMHHTMCVCTASMYVDNKLVGSVAQAADNLTIEVSVFLRKHN